jgi:deazaflavin-dependent oxidoreductase (nitroreductase family)
MSEIPTVPPIVNRTMKFVLRSPMHGIVDKKILLITFTGRKSGKTYTTPVSYSQSDGQVVVFTHADWWKNLRGDVPVMLHIRGRELQGLAEPIAEDKQAVAAGLAEHLRKVRSDAKYYSVTFDDQGNPRSAEVEIAAQTVVMISIQLC